MTRIITTKLCRQGYAFALLQRIFIHPESPRYLIPHEEVHVAQQRRDGWRWYWRYLTDSDARLQYEAPAHAAAVDAGQPLHIAAAQLATNYGTGIGYSDALILISRYRRG